MDAAGSRSLVSLFLEQAALRGDRPFLWRRDARRWTAHAYAEARREVSEVSRGFRALGLARGDRVALVSENRPEFRSWIAAAIDCSNLRLFLPERVRRFAIVREPYTVESGLLTPTPKLLRHLILERHTEVIESLSEGREAR